MASNAFAVATQAPPTTGPLPTTTATVASDDTTRLLKRQREPEPTSPRPFSAHQVNPLGSPAKSARLALAAQQSALPLTGAAALEDERRRREEEERFSSPPAISENPSHTALASLISGGAQSISRPSDAPPSAPIATMDPAAKAVTALSIPANSTGHAEDRDDTSPQSSTSMAGVPVTQSPTPMDVDNPPEHASSQQVAGQEERPQPVSLSYPGSLQTTGSLTETPARRLSFPMPGQGQTSPTSSSSKKHKCPYCNTEFTRHHNLKSHLLTHSQEKPYVCTDCQMRFRRLHDLKRHGKLHSGEKPHVCPKCDRKFARGDALARHSKGAGGCAGRRSSMGSFVDGDELEGMGEGDDSMTGMSYDNGEGDESRRQTLPNINAQQLAGVQGDSFGPQSRTYPPAGGRSSSGLYPPNVNQANMSTSASGSTSITSSHTPNASISSHPAGGGGAGMYSQAGVTESPKPLSPGLPGVDASGLGRQRSPGLSQQLQQQHMGRRQSELQSPRGSQSRPKLPGLSHAGYGSQGSSGFAPGRVPNESNLFAGNDAVWTYIQAMEENLKAVLDKVDALEHEVAGLRKQLER